MYAYVDRPVAQLDPASQLLIWAMRSWVELAGRRRCPDHAIGAVFARRNMMAGLQPFLRMMATLNRAGLENFMFCRPTCGHVSEHEAILLQMVDEARSNPGTRLAATLALVVEEECITGLLEVVLALGRALGCSGLTGPPTERNRRA